MIKKKYTDEELVNYYSIWSEEFYCAGFLTPDPGSVRQFRNWLHNEKDNPLIERTEPWEDYEKEFLEEFKRLENEGN